MYQLVNWTLPYIGMIVHDASLKQDPVVNSDQVGVNIDDKHVVLVDDVIYTGRTIRAAMDALMHVGRPCSIRVAVLVDRGSP